jgi:hypothetical protein
MYALGLPVLRRRNSTFINGAEADARDLAQHLAGYLAGCGGPGYYGAQNGQIRAHNA